MHEKERNKELKKEMKHTGDSLKKKKKKKTKKDAQQSLLSPKTKMPKATKPCQVAYFTKLIMIFFGGSDTAIIPIPFE